jgi:hypothetical protein
MNIANLIEGSIPFLAGIYFTLIALNKITFELDYKRQNWVKKYRNFFLIGGPTLIIFGTLQMLGVFARNI